MRLDGLHRQAQTGGDRLVAVSLGDELQHFPLACRQPVQLAGGDAGLHARCATAGRGTAHRGRRRGSPRRARRRQSPSRGNPTRPRLALRERIPHRVHAEHENLDCGKVAHDPSRRFDAVERGMATSTRATSGRSRVTSSTISFPSPASRRRESLYALEECADSLTDDGMIVCERDPDHRYCHAIRTNVSFSQQMVTHVGFRGRAGPLLRDRLEAKRAAEYARSFTHAEQSQLSVQQARARPEADAVVLHTDPEQAARRRLERDAHL